MSRVRLNRLAGPLLLLAVAACSGSDGKTSVDVKPPPVTPQVLSFAADPELIQVGGSATLTWRTQNAASIVITDGAGTELPLAGADIANGSVEVTPAATTSYTLTATGAEGAAGPVWRTAIVTVQAVDADAPTIDQFSATPETVAVGGEVILAWRTTNATRLTLKDDAGTAIDLGAAAVDEGQVAVRPNRPNMTFSLVATGPGGRANASVNVSVTGLPRVASFYVDPIAPVAPGSPVTLYWETVNTTHVTIRQAGATIVDTGTELSGSHELVVSDNATFDLVATGPGGTATATTLAQVGAGIVSFTASERVVREGDPVDLAWTLDGADSAVLDGPGGYHLALTGPALSSGTATVNVTASGDFVLRAFRGTVVRTASIAIDVTAAPRVRSLAVDQPVVTAAALFPATVTLSWTQDGADTCTILRNNEPVANFTDFACAHTGSAELQVFGNAALKLVAVNAAGTHAAIASVQGIPPATVAAFASQPARRLTPGSQVELSWTVVDAVSISMEKNGGNFPVPPTAFASTASDVVDMDSVYTLTALNSLGHATTAQLVVRAGAPVVLTATATPSFVGIGDAVALSWTADGGETLTVTDHDGLEVFRTTDPAVIDAGSVDVLAPLVAGTYHYTVTSTNGRGETDAKVIELVVSDGPMIRSFTASKASISLGETLTVSWNVTNDPSGTTPTLALTDNYGHTFDISSKNPNNGSFTFTPAEEGAHVYTLTAQTAPGRTVATATLPIEITVKPIVVAFTATPNSVSTQNGTVVPQVVLAWQSQNGVEVTLWESDAAGNVIPPPLHRVALANGDAQAALDAGSFTVGPTATTYYVLRVKNRVGSYVDSKVKVVVDPPQVLTFQAEPAEVIEGESVQFSWTTKDATGVRLDPLPAVVTRLGNTFFDVSANGGTKSTLTGDTALAVIDLPTGFVFPFAGTNRTQIQVSTNGWAGFNLTNTGNVSTPGVLPNESYRYANFAVFTGDLDSTKGATPGELWYGKGTDAKGDFFAIQWKNWSWYSSTYNPSVLNFELVLRTSGDFEYRYGTMTSNQADHATGVGSSLGFQFVATGSPGMNVVPNSTAVPGGLANTGFAFQLTYPVNGTITATPMASGTYTVTAFNDDASASKDASVTVWKVPAIASVSLSPSAPESTRPFRVQWAASNATRVRVLDTAGAELCRVTDPAQLASGSCTLTEATAGIKAYTVEAINGLERNKVTKTLNFSVFPLLSLDSFTVTPGTFVTSGTAVTLTWTATGATEMQLFACVPGTLHGKCTEITPAGANPNGGTLTYTMTKSVDFWMRVYDVQYRVRDSSIPVWVNAPTLGSFTASATQVSAGGSTSLSWTTTNATSVSFSGAPVQAPVSNTATAPFIDVSATGTKATLAGGTADAGYFDVVFPDGFAFPWFGAPKTAVRVSTDGWITFDTNYTTTHGTEYTMPTSSTYAAVQIAAFWDDLKQNTGNLYWKMDQTPAGLKYVVIQWKNWAFSSSTYNPSDLNFEAVLFENGDVDVRYGTMTAPTAYATYASGDSAAIGWQSPDVKVGKMLTAAAGDVVTGGLANRSWRFPFAIDPNSSTIVSPTDSTTYQVCVTNGSLYVDCRSIRVVVVKPGDLLFSELMIAPATDDAEWFEVRNTASDPIDVAGWQLQSGTTEQFTIPTTSPVVVQPGGFAVFARSATANGGLTPNVVYGNALALADAADDLRLYMGASIIDSVTWSGTGWTIPAGKSIALEPSVMARSSTANDSGASWCPTAATYGNGTFTGSPGTLGVGCLSGGALNLYVLDPVAGAPFIDISGSGVNDSAILDSTYYTSAIGLGFSMPYFTDTVNQFQITKHGYIAFPAQTTYYSSNVAMPNTSAPNGYVAPFFDYIYNTTGTSFLHHKAVTIGTRQAMIVQWTKVAGGSMSYGTLDFQIQLYDNGDIAFVYRNVEKLNASYDYVYGTSATIGIENNAGTDAIQLFYGTATSGSGPIYSGRSFMFRRR